MEVYRRVQVSSSSSSPIFYHHNNSITYKIVIIEIYIHAALGREKDGPPKMALQKWSSSNDFNCSIPPPPLITITFIGLMVILDAGFRERGTILLVAIYNGPKDGITLNHYD